MTENNPTTEDDLANDLLDGVQDYAALTGFSPRRCFYLLARKHLPGGKIGSRWIGSKKRVREYLKRIAAGEAA